MHIHAYKQNTHAHTSFKKLIKLCIVQISINKSGNRDGGRVSKAQEIRDVRDGLVDPEGIYKQFTRI